MFLWNVNFLILQSLPRPSRSLAVKVSVTWKFDALFCFVLDFSLIVYSPPTHTHAQISPQCRMSCRLSLSFPSRSIGWDCLFLCVASQTKKPRREGNLLHKRRVGGAHTTTTQSSTKKLEGMAHTGKPLEWEKANVKEGEALGRDVAFLIDFLMS